MRFYVSGQTLTRAGREIVATEAVNYPNVEIEFDSSWDGVAGRTAVFQSVNTVYNAVTPSAIDGTAYGMLLTEGEDGIWRTHVPHEILDEDAPNKFIVTVYGGSANSKRITTNSVTIEITDSFYDPGQTPGTPTPSQWDQVVDLLEEIEDDVNEIPGLITDVGELQNDVSDIETEIADARIDTNDTTWPTLGQAIRGQVTGFKNYMQYSGFLAEITTQEGKKWQAGQNNTVELVDAEDNTTSAISAKILYQPTGCYIRMRNNNHSGQFTEWWGLNSEEVVIQNDTNLVRNQFIFNELERGVSEIRFNSDTEKIAAAQVICSNETYGYQYDQVNANTKTIDWITKNLAKEELLGNASAQRWQTEVTLDPPYGVGRGTLLHIKGTSTGGLYLGMKIYNSNPTPGIPWEQKFYDNQESETNIDIYVYVNITVADTFRVWSKYGNAYNLNIYKVVFDQKVDDLVDVIISSPINGDVLTYDAANQKWRNLAPSSGGHVYSTTEQEVGTFFNSTVYEKSYLFTDSVAPNASITLDASLDSGTVSWIWLQNISLRDTSSGNIYATENIRGIGTTVASTSSGLKLTNNAGGITISMGIVTVRYLKVS